MPTGADAEPAVQLQARQGSPPPTPQKPAPHGRHCAAAEAKGLAEWPGGQAAARHGVSPPGEKWPDGHILQSLVALVAPARVEAVPAGQAVFAHCALPPGPHCAGWQLAHAQPSVVPEA
jgi:hypothetical protein